MKFLPPLLAAFLLNSPGFAGERTIALKNWVERDWPRTLLHHDLEFAAGEFSENKVELLDATAQPVPHHVVAVERHGDNSIKRCRLSFYTGLKKGEALTFTLRSKDKAAPVEPMVSARTNGDVLELANATAAIRIPAPGEKGFVTPIEPRNAPAPILSFRLADGTWAGKGWIESERKVTRFSQIVVADGPLYKEYAYEIGFTAAETGGSEGVYKMRVGLEAEQPVVHVAEEFDMGRATAGHDFFVLALNADWKPDLALWTSWVKPEGATEIQARGSRADDMGLFSEKLGFAADRQQQQFYPWREYGTKANIYGLFDGAGAAESPFVGLVSQHVGAWRLPDSSLSPIVWTKAGEVLAKLRLSTNTQGTPMNLFSTAQIDPELPQTLGRRVWLLTLGPRPAADPAKKLDVARLDALRNYDGFVSLNDYKDWVLTWPEQELPRPRVVTTPDAIARLKANLDRCPGGEAIKNFYLLTGKPETARADATQLLKALDDRFNSAISAYTPGFRQIQPDEGLIFLADSCLSSKTLPVATREAIRAKCAAQWHLTMHPNYYPRGAGVHLGNPNMTFNRSMGIPMWGTLLQDHPRAKAVLEDMAGFTKWLSGYNITPGGGVFRDSPHYTTYGPALFMTKAAIALRNAGYDLDQWPVFAELGRYFTSLESSPAKVRNKTYSPEFRARPVRHLPAFGNGSDVTASQSELQLASLMARTDPAFASQMMGAFEEAGSYLGTGDSPSAAWNWLYWDPAIIAAKPARSDQIIAGFGGVLRAHSSQADETYVALRSGYMQSHWASHQGSDQGSFVLYARGANLCPGPGWMYSEVPKGFVHDSRLTFGDSLKSPFGFVDTNIEDYGFLPSLGYLAARQPFKGKDAAGAFEWSRHVLLMRSEKAGGPTYAVVRDTMAGPAPKSAWHQWIQAPSDRVNPVANGVHAETPEGVVLDVIFVEPSAPEIAIKGTKIKSFDEDYTQVSVPQEAALPYMSVFFPRQGDEPALAVEKLAPGVAKITTRQSVDYVFCSDQPITFKNADLEIAAHAGAVRVFPDKVLLVNASAHRGLVAWRAMRAEGNGPFEQTVAVTPAGPKTIDASRKLPMLEAPAAQGQKLMLKGDGKSAEDERAFSNSLIGHVVAADGKQTIVVTEGLGRIGFGDFWIQGEAPFVVVREPGTVTLQTDGRRRIFQMPIPLDLAPLPLVPPYETLPTELKNESIIWPCAVDVQIDGISRQGGWYDGRMTTGVPEGKHTVVFRPYTNPPAWRENADTRLLPVPKTAAKNNP